MKAGWALGANPMYCGMSIVAGKVTVGYYSFEGYLNALVLPEALRRSGRELSRSRMISALKGLKMRVAGMDWTSTTRSTA